jgi:hypothetical protein
MKPLQAYTQTNQQTQVSGPLATRLCGRKLLLARTIGIIIALGTIATFISSIPTRFDLLRSYASTDLVGLDQLGFSSTSFAFSFMALHIGLMVVFASTALIIFWHRSDDWMAMFTSIGLVLFGTFGPFFFYSLGRFSSPENIPLTLVQALGLGMSFTYYYIFPSGRFVPRWIWILTAIYIIWACTWFFYPPANILTWPLWLAYVVISIFIVFGVFAQFYRYHRVSNPLERQQTKWVVLGLTIIAVGLNVFHLLRLLSPPGLTQTQISVIGIPFISFFDLAVPISMGIAVLRYRLWDIDPLINRVLVYSTLTGLLIAMYFGIILLLQFLLNGLISQKDNLIIVVSTLAIAALFQPVRRHIQRVIDRRFYRQQYDAARTLETFGATLRNEAELTQLSEQLLAVVNETMQPTQVSLWFCSPQWSNKGES